jgi:hypothetical protein
VLAIRAEIPLWILRDTMAQFPTFSEALGAALRTLPGVIGAPMEHPAHPMMSSATRETR